MSKTALRNDDRGNARTGWSGVIGRGPDRRFPAAALAKFLVDEVLRGWLVTGSGPGRNMRSVGQ
jgi:hypothetical protein